jgi:large subunit ribosomal protein L6
MKEAEIREEIEVPKEVEIKIEKGLVTAKGKKGECSKKLLNPKLSIEVKEGKVVVSAKKATKRQKTMMVTFAAHIANMIRGANEGHVYRLKICSGHFPMNVAVSGKEFVVKNFLGEKNPRTVKIKEGVDVKIEGDIIVVESCSKELAGQTAADIESSTRITNRDLRIFQDGIYITEKDGRPVR